MNQVWEANSYEVVLDIYRNASLWGALKEKKRTGLWTKGSPGEAEIGESQGMIMGTFNLYFQSP